MFKRYAVYYTPDGAFADAGAAWLGRDIAAGAPVPHPEIEGVDVATLTRTPRQYGFHGTIKPPFRLAPAMSRDGLESEFGTLCGRLAPVTLDGLEVRATGRFIALVPDGPQDALSRLAAQVVADLDPFRAPAGADELARRRKARLTPAQEHNLVTWGYPYVMDSFRFHITLTGRVNGDAEPVIGMLRKFFGPYLASPFKLETLTLAGEDEDGFFHEIIRRKLTG